MVAAQQHFGETFNSWSRMNSAKISLRLANTFNNTSDKDILNILLKKVKYMISKSLEMYHNNTNLLNPPLMLRPEKRCVLRLTSRQPYVAVIESRLMAMQADQNRTRHLQTES